MIATYKTMTQQIQCPFCHKDFPLDDAIGHQLEEKLQQEFDIKQKQKDIEIAEKEKELTEKEKQIEAGRQNLSQIVAERVATAVKVKETEISAKAKEEATKEVSIELEGLKEVLKQKDTKLEELRKDQVELMKEKQKFEDDKKAFDLEMMKKEEEITKKVSEELGNQMGEKYQHQIAELNKKLTDAQKANEEMDRKLKQGSQQTQGEVLELELEELLKQKFIYDEIIPVPKGVNGADVIQKVKNNNGRVYGTIVWESKRTKNWVEGWIQKLNDDKRREKADVAVIVSNCLPEGVKNFEIRDGVTITNFQSVMGIATLLRNQIFRISEVKISNQDREKKSEIVYEYLISNEFKQRIEVWLEYFKNRQEEINKERLYFTKKWEKEDKNLQKIFLNTAGIYGDIQGSIGSALPKIDILELPEGDI